MWSGSGGLEVTGAGASRQVEPGSALPVIFKAALFLCHSFAILRQSTFFPRDTEQGKGNRTWK